MKRLILILLFIIIVLRILQQLYVRVISEELIISGHKSGGLVGVTTQSLSNSTNGFCDKLPGFNVHGLITYNDGFYPKTVKNNIWHISSHSINSDKVLFTLKGLISSTKKVLCLFHVSIHVWKGVFSDFRAVLLEKIERGFNMLFHSSISDMVIGLTLGIDKASTGGNKHLFKVTGTQHLMAISGFNLSFFVAFVNRLYGKFFSKSTVLVLNLLSASFFLWIVGMYPGLIRAFLMFVVSHLALLLKRQTTVVYSFCFTLIIVILIDLSSILEVGFQLSYAATLGIILFSTFHSKTESVVQTILINSSSTSMSLLEYLFVGLSVSFAAQVMVVPLLLYYFQEFSLVGGVATVVVSWAMPLILQLGILAAVAQFVVPLKILFLFSIPLVLISKTVLFLLNLFNYDFFLLAYSGFNLWLLLGYYSTFLLIYVLILLFIMSKKRKKYAEIYHFRF